MQKMRLIGWLLFGAIAIFLGRGQRYTYVLVEVEADFAEVEIGTTVATAEVIPSLTPVAADALQPVVALVQDEPTAVNGYPGSTETSLPTATEAYPVVQPSPLPADTAGDESNPPPIPIIGDETEAATAPEAATSGRPINSRQAMRGRLFLWGGFLVALFLFITGVAGSIVLFMRRRG